jgi:hypothetical protein
VNPKNRLEKFEKTNSWGAPPLAETDVECHHQSEADDSTPSRQTPIIAAIRGTQTTGLIKIGF